jgi:hypothetical protein
MEMKLIWQMFKKNEDNELDFCSYFDSFRRAGAIKVIDFEDDLRKLIKKFSSLI